MKKLILAGFISLFGVLGVIGTPQPASAINIFQNCNTGVVCQEANSGKTGVPKLVQNIINILLYAVAVISVIMIIIGGIRYTTSNGEASKVTSGKNTVMYAVVGLIVAIMAYAIVNFAVTWATK